MNRLTTLLRENLRIAIAIAVGLLVVLIIGLTTRSVTAISFSGLAVGILVGMLIAAESNRRETAARRGRRR